MEMEKVFEYIDSHADEQIAILQKAISLKSTTGNELCFQEWFAPLCEDAGLCADSFAVDSQGIRPNVVAVLKGSGGGQDIILNGHCDVVPVADEDLSGWNSDPWAGQVRDGNIYGRGTADMKGGLIAGFFAVKALIECGVRLKGDVILESVVGEELCHHDVGTSATVARGYTAPLAIVLEASDNALEVMAPSAASFTLSVKGKSIHSSRANLVRYPQRFGRPHGPEAGVDAFRKMNKILDALYDMEEQWNFRWRNKILDDSVGVGMFTFVPGIINAGEYLVSVPGKAEVQGSYTYAPWEEDGAGEREIRSVIDSVVSHDDWLKENPPEFNVLYDWPGYMIDPDHPGCRALRAAAKQVTGREMKISAFPGADDATWLYKEQIPSVTFGPASPDNNLHGNNEFMSIAQMSEATKILAAAIINWCETADGR